MLRQEKLLVWHKDLFMGPEGDPPPLHMEPFYAPWNESCPADGQVASAEVSERGFGIKVQYG